MDPKELKRIFHRGNCLSLETMRLYNEGNLPPKTAHAVEEHLLECALCASAIDGLSKTRISEVTKVSDNINKRLGVYMNTPPHTPVLSRFGVAVIVSSLLIGISITVWLLAKDDSQPEKDLADSGTVTQYQPPAGTGVEPEVVPENSDERSQDNGTVSVHQGTEVVSDDKQSRNDVVTLNNLPATQPGDEKTLTVDSEIKNEQPGPPDEPDNTRQVATDQFLRIKSVIVYPPTTHTDKKSNDGGGGNNGQLNRSENNKGQFELDEMPTYPGGNEALKQYILSNYVPQKEDKANLKRKSTGVMFQVNVKTGEVTDASLSFPISPLTDAELLRVVNAMPDWAPGKKRGTVDVMLGITFE